ncbi:serine hydrolase domain-containing protein [Pseudooctadecabacter sp.]|uniref:serine hydrolase domain-containing protein n=1 Tax=Pseudooctadecabacter sp. TaxID=1966338 RepID=UPI0035C79134
MQAWEEWLVTNDVTQSALAITKDGILLSDHGRGMQADDAVPLASLSKAVTGACVLALQDEGLLEVSDTLDTVFAATPDRVGQGGDITIDALLTHTSGLDFDRTQTVLNPSLWGASDMHDQIADLALARPLGAAEFFYNNENYAVLGSVIMQVTGQSVAEACAPRVLAGQPTAAPDRRTGGGLAYGGWSMSVEDYAAFTATLAPDDDWPGAPVGGGAYYGPGVLVRDMQNGTNLWHFGGFCLMGLGDYGSYFYVLENGWGVVVWYDICASGAQAVALDNALARAAYSGE